MKGKRTIMNLCIVSLALTGVMDAGASAALDRATARSFNEHVARINAHLNELKDQLRSISQIEAEFMAGHRQHQEAFLPFLRARYAYMETPGSDTRRTFLQAVGNMHKVDSEFVEEWSESVLQRNAQIQAASETLEAALTELKQVERIAQRAATRKATVEEVEQERNQRLRENISRLNALLASINGSAQQEIRIRKTMQVILINTRRPRSASADVGDSVKRDRLEFESARKRIRSLESWACRERRFVRLITAMIEAEQRST